MTTSQLPLPLTAEDWRQIKGQRARLLAYMLSHGEFKSLAEIREAVGGGDTGNSAGLRAFRKKGYDVQVVRLEWHATHRWLYRVGAYLPT